MNGPFTPVATVLLLAAAGAAAPVFQSTAVDLGTILEGDSAAATFTYSNAGPNPFILEEVRTGCACVATAVERRRIEAGERGEIGITFLSAGLNGPQTRDLWALFTAPGDSTGQSSAVQLTLNAFVKCEVMFIPPSINGMWATDGGFTARGELMNTSGHPLRVTALEMDTVCGLKAVAAGLPAELQHGQRLPFTVSAATRPAAATRITARVVAVTTETRYPRHGCAVTVFLK